MDTASASPFTGRSKIFFLHSGFCFGCFEMSNFVKFGFSSREERKKGTTKKKNVDFTRFGMRSHTPTKLGRAIESKDDDDGDDDEEEEDMEERTQIDADCDNGVGLSAPAAQKKEIFFSVSIKLNFLF